MSLLQSLPGISTPVSEVTKALAQMWQGESAGSAPSEFRASQMNLILHFGLATTDADAQETFQIALRFAQRYPCRIIVLCPTENEPPGEAILEGKLFSQCYIGDGHGEMNCCEALILGYHCDAARFLEDQVSIWLESDLPTYHWFHHVPAAIIGQRYLSFTKACKRIIYDSTIDGYAYQSLSWPRPDNLRDLAWARILPIRQSLGQFLSAFPAATLIEGLCEIKLIGAPSRRGEAENLLCWLYGCLHKCRDDWDGTKPIEWSSHPATGPETGLIYISWHYINDHYFHFKLISDNGEASIEADFGDGPIRHPLQIMFLKPEEALAESLFF
ncbi:MAG: glucose-6-phosphate dehydrogenase assembly protein OpcA [Verrucomicrobiota bacterium]|nr:glucose-6-phosphate dehydrogenase assembly protein OpcA [Verrucomicrobiota bacterium]